MIRLGVIGGSGLYELKGLEGIREKRIRTPFGSPSGVYRIGRLGEHELCFLPRHGAGHRLLPSEIPHRANIFGFKKLGVDAVVSISAVGSLRGPMRPRDVVLPDQYVDRTKSRDEQTFFGNGLVAHVAFGEPSCPVLRDALAGLIRTMLRDDSGKRRLFSKGVYVNMEGPAFSTRAESLMYRRMGFDVIGMTSLAEAKLCREAGLCYQTIAMVTDYDCWHRAKTPVTVDMIVGHLQANITLAHAILVRLPDVLARRRFDCTCGHALDNAILTAPAAIPAALRRILAPILGARGAA